MSSQQERSEVKDNHQNLTTAWHVLKNTDPEWINMSSHTYHTLFTYFVEETFAVHHLYFSASTAAKAERYLSMAACASGVKSSPKWQASATSRQCVRSCRENHAWLESNADQFRFDTIIWWMGAMLEAP